MDKNNNSCENEVDEDLEDGEIFDEEDDVEMGESTEQNTESEVSKENNFGVGGKKKDFESLSEMEQMPQLHQQILHGPTSKPFVGFNNSRPTGDRFSRNTGTTMKRDLSYQTDDDRSRIKRRRFDQMDEKDPLIRNNQNGLFNRRKNETLIEAVEDNDEEMLSGANPDVPNFESFPREFEDDGWGFRPPRGNNFGRRERGRRGGENMDRHRGMPTKRRMGVGSVMKNKQYENEEKVCQYFLQGKCLKENNCTYSHQQPNGRKMKLCKFYLMNCCSKGDRCTFMHSDFPCKYYHTGRKCYSGQSCQFSHAKLDEDQKKILRKNNFEEDSIPIIENNFNSKNDKNKIPSLLEMQIPVPPELKITEKNSEEDLEANNNHNNNSIPMPSPSREECIVYNTFEINESEQLPKIIPNNRSAHKSKKHDKNKDNKERQRQGNENGKKQREEKLMEKNRQPKDDLSIHTNEHLLLDDLSDDDEFNDLVIDEEKFHDGKDQQLPKKQKELLKRNQVTQKFYNEKNISEDTYNQEEQYLNDVSDHSVSTPMKNIINSLQNENKEHLPSSSSSQSNLSIVEKVDFDQITISDDMVKLLNSIKAQIGSDISLKGDQSSPFHLPPLEPLYDFKESVQKMKLASVAESHPPMEYKIIPMQVSVTDYSKIRPTMGIDDPRVRQNVTAARDPVFTQSVSLAANTTVKSVVPQEFAPRDPRKYKMRYKY